MLARTFLGISLLAGALPIACGGEPYDVGDEPVAQTESPIFNGTPVNQNEQIGAVAVYRTGAVRPCSGTAIRRQWILTAKHCITISGKGTPDSGPLISPSAVSVTDGISPGLQPPPSATSRGTQFLASIWDDIALIRVHPELPATVKLAGLWNGKKEALPNSIVRAMGYGRNVEGGLSNVEDGTTGAGTLRRADLLVTSVAETSFTVAINAGQQQIWRGDSGGPSFRMADIFGRLLPGVVGVHQWGVDNHSVATDGLVPAFRSWIKRRSFQPGDFNKNGIGDIALVGGAGSTTIAIASATGSDATGFTTVTKTAGLFPTWAQTSGARPVAGDFNGDSFADIVLVGGAGWNSLPMAMSQGSAPDFNVQNHDEPLFASWTRIAGVRALPGDFDGDGKSDIALSGASGWGSIPVAFSRGDGRFNVKNLNTTDFPGWASLANVKILSGDFDGDGRDDVALTGVSGWQTIPVAFSNGDGTFLVKNLATPNFPAWAATAGAQAVAGDFDTDGRDDIALTGVAGWTTIPVALSNGDGTFRMVNNALPDFASWAAIPGAKAVSGDFNSDIRDDIALTGVPGWGSIPVAMSTGAGGTFRTINPAVASFPALAATSGAKPVSGH